MTIELNRRTFLALIGASSVAATMARPVSFSISEKECPAGTPRCFMDGLKTRLPVRPKTAAITYIHEEHLTSNIQL